MHRDIGQGEIQRGRRREERHFRYDATFPCQGNFLHGSIEYIQEMPLGTFLMELQGEPNEIQKAIDFMVGQEANVEVLEK